MLAVSSEAQIETLAHQQAMAQGVATAKGWSLERVIGTGKEGVGTGKHGPRAVLMRLIADIRALPADARPEWVWMRRVDRVGRGRIADSQLALHELADLGVRIWDHDAGEVKLDSASDQIIAALKSGLAALENEVRSGKARATHARKKAAGLPTGKVPYGLQLGPGGHYVALEPQATSVREAFALCADGQGAHRIARHLIATAAPYPYKRGGRPVQWDSARVYRMLRNTAYIGTVVDEMTFARAERARADKSYRPPNRKHPWPLSGALRCWCGRAMAGRAAGHRSGKTHFARYYVCPALWNHDGRWKMRRADDLERQFVELLNRFAADPAELERMRSAAPVTSPALLERAAATARKLIDEIAAKRQAVFDLHAAGHIRAADVQERLDALAADRDAAVAEADELDARARTERLRASNVADAAAIVDRAATTWAQAAEEEQREIARTVAATLGGLCVEDDGTLTIRRPPMMDHPQSVRVLPG